MLCNSYDSKILHEEFHWIYLPGEIKLLLVTVNNRLILKIEIVHDLSCHPIWSHPKHTAYQINQNQNKTWNHEELDRHRGFWTRTGHTALPVLVLVFFLIKLLVACARLSWPTISTSVHAELRLSHSTVISLKHITHFQWHFLSQTPFVTHTVRRLSCESERSRPEYQWNYQLHRPSLPSRPSWQSLVAFRLYNQKSHYIITVLCARQRVKR